MKNIPFFPMGMGTYFYIEQKNSIHRVSEQRVTNILRIRAVRQCLQNGVAAQGWNSGEVKTMVSVWSSFWMMSRMFLMG